MRLGEPQFPRKARVVDGTARRRAGPSVVSGDQDDLRARLGDARRDRADARLRDQLHVDPGIGVGVLEVVDQLRQVLDRIDIVVRRRRDERHPRGRIAGLGDPGVHFFARKVAALAGLSPLRHLDLDLLRAAQVGAGHAEAPGGHLLDLAVPDRSEALRQLAALARIGAGADGVHRDRQGLVRLGGQRAVAHRAGLEALYDLRGGFHFVDRDRVARRHELQEPAQRVRPLRVVHKVRVLPEFLIRVLPHRSLQRDDRLGTVHVVLFVVPAAKAVESHGVQRLVDAQSQRVKSVIVPERYSLFDLFDADAAHSAHGPGKIAIDDIFSQPDRFKDAGGLIRLEGRNAHFGRYFDNARQKGLVIILHGCVVILVEDAQLDQLADALVRQIRVDRAHAEAEERRDLVDVPGLAALQDQ